jgi:methylated-DNA-[protein]-cysteine S-methyltransferase
MAYRAVGNALLRNPYAPIVPCHRVVNSNGDIGGFGGGIKKKKQLLRKEGIKIKDDKIEDFESVLYRF